MDNQCFYMGLPDKAVALTPDRIADLNRRLGMLRHNVNNQLALIVAASELIRRKPEVMDRLVENILQQPDRIIAELRSFTDDFEEALGITHEPGFSTTQLSIE
jgi:hypothetical protein